MMKRCWHKTGLVLYITADPDVKLCMRGHMSALLLTALKCPHITQRGNRAVLQDAGWMKVAIHYSD